MKYSDLARWMTDGWSQIWGNLFSIARYLNAYRWMTHAIKTLILVIRLDVITLKRVGYKKVIANPIILSSSHFTECIAILVSGRRECFSRMLSWSLGILNTCSEQGTLGDCVLSPPSTSRIPSLKYPRWWFQTLYLPRSLHKIPILITIFHETTLKKWLFRVPGM